MLRTLKLKIQITGKKAQVLDRMGYVATKLWNTANWERKDQWKKTGQIPNYAQQAGELKTNHWYKKLPSLTAQAKQCLAYNSPVNADLNGARNILNRYLRLGLTARKVLVGSLAIPMINRWNFHTWASHKWKLSNRVSPSLRNQRPGNIPLVESHAEEDTLLI